MVYFKFKKGITPIVAILLLLFVAVSSGVFFKNWYSDFTSGVITDYDKVSPREIDMKYLDGETLYLQSSHSKDFEYDTIEIAGFDCNLNGTIKANSMNKINVASCLQDLDLGAKEVLIVSDAGVFAETLMLRTVVEAGSFLTAFTSGVSCSDVSYTKLFAINGLSDAHIELGNQSSYTYSYCLKHEDYVIGNDCSSLNHVELFYLYGETDSHVWLDNSNPYKPVSNWKTICFSSNAGNITKQISSSNPNDGSICVGSFIRDDSYGGVMGDCDAYSNKMWVKIE